LQDDDAWIKLHHIDLNNCLLFLRVHHVRVLFYVGWLDGFYGWVFRDGFLGLRLGERGIGLLLFLIGRPNTAYKLVIQPTSYSSTTPKSHTNNSYTSQSSPSSSPPVSDTAN
jgi:hypothetical protein